MILFINTSDFNNLHLALVGNDVKEFTTSVAFNENYKTNALLESFLKKHGVTPKQLTKIIVCNGPGSFTGIRVGVSLAQAFGFALHIPVVAIPKNKIPTDLYTLTTKRLPEKLTLQYGQKPNITKQKK